MNTLQIPTFPLLLVKQALGISSNGKSTAQLGALIKAATKSLLASAPSLINPNALSKHFEEGRFTDCTIRVRIKDGRPAKRLRSEKGDVTGVESNATEDEEDDVRVIKAHAVILASRSAYFERAMGGEWRESQDRSFEVEVADETGAT
jgi:ribosomal protein L21E